MDARLTVVAALVLLVLPAALAAQETTEPTAEQKELNRAAFKAMKAGDAEGAIAAYESSIELGALNVTYLNLGRAHQKQGDCGAAWAAFSEVQGAPAVPRPDRAAVTATLEKFRAELRAECPTTIRVTCEPDNGRVRLVDEDFVACPTTFDVEPGSYVVELESQVSTTATVEATFGESVDVHIVDEYQPISDPVEPMVRRPAVITPPPELESTAEPGPSVALLAAGAGLIVVGALGGAASAYADGVIVPRTPAFAHDHRLTAADFIPVGGYALSFSAMVTGAIMMLRALR